MNLFDIVAPLTIEEAKTDYQKRRQRERDVDAGKPVSRQAKNPQTDYAKKRAEQKRQEALGEDSWHGEGDSWHGGDNAWSSDSHEMVEGRLSVGDPVIVTAPNEFEGKTGEISEFSPSGKFVIVNLYNYGEHSMHLSDVEYNQYADEEDEVDEDTSTSPVTNAITRRILQQRLDLLKQYGPDLVGAAVDNVADYVGDVEEIGSSDVSGWVAQVERMLKENPPEAFAESKLDEMVEHMYRGPHGHADVERKGGVTRVTRRDWDDTSKATTDVKGGKYFPNKDIKGQGTGSVASTNTSSLNQIPGGSYRKMPKLDHDANDAPNYDVDEGFQDFNKVEPYEVCLAGKPVKTFDYYEEARRFHDNWKKKLYAQGEKAKADSITLNPVMKESQTDYQKRRQRERDVDAGKPVSRQPKNPQTDYAKKRAQDKKDALFGEAEADPNAPYTPSPAKPFRNPPGFNKQGTGVGNRLAQQTRAELAKKKQPGVAEGEDDDVEHLANTFADLYWGGKIGMTSATEKVKMAHKIIQAVEDGRLSIEELKQDIRDLDKPGVAEGHADQQRKIFKKNGKPVGEVGIDRESSPGAGQWYMKHYASGKDLAGYDSYEEAVAELKHCMKQGVAEVYTPAPVKKPRSPNGFNKQGTGLGNKLAQLTRAELNDKNYDQLVKYLPATKPVKENDPCWKNYKQVGMKDKNGKQVPNCVPKESVQESYWTKLQDERNTKIASLINELKESIK